MSQLNPAIVFWIWTHLLEGGWRKGFCAASSIRNVLYVFTRSSFNFFLSTSCNPLFFLKCTNRSSNRFARRSRAATETPSGKGWSEDEENFDGDGDDALGLVPVLGSLRMCPLLTPWQIIHRTCTTNAIAIAYFIVPGVNVSWQRPRLRGNRVVAAVLCRHVGPWEVVDHRSSPPFSMNTLVLAARKAQSKAGYYFTYTLTGGPSAPFSILQVLIVTLALSYWDSNLNLQIVVVLLTVVMCCHHFTTSASTGGKEMMFCVYYY